MGTMIHMGMVCNMLFHMHFLISVAHIFIEPFITRLLCSLKLDVKLAGEIPRTVFHALGIEILVNSWTPRGRARGVATATTHIPIDPTFLPHYTILAKHVSILVLVASSDAGQPSGSFWSTTGSTGWVTLGGVCQHLDGIDVTITSFGAKLMIWHGSREINSWCRHHHHMTTHEHSQIPLKSHPLMILPMPLSFYFYAFYELVDWLDDCMN